MNKKELMDKILEKLTNEAKSAVVRKTADLIDDKLDHSQQLDSMRYILGTIILDLLPSIKDVDELLEKLLKNKEMAK